MYTTNVWEEGYNWNGVIFPATKSQLKPFTNKDSAIKGHENYIGRETGDIGFDLYWLSKKSYEAQQFAISEIDRIKKLDVPWKCYIAAYVVMMALAAVGCWVLAMYVSMRI